MKDKPDNSFIRSTPPESPEEWQRVWLAVHLSPKVWLVVGPVHALITNWRAWALGVSIFAFIERGEVWALVMQIMEAGS